MLCSLLHAYERLFFGPAFCLSPLYVLPLYALPLSLLASIEDFVVVGGDGMGDGSSRRNSSWMVPRSSQPGISLLIDIEGPTTKEDQREEDEECLHRLLPRFIWRPSRREG